MRYFTRAWATGELSQAETESVIRAYRSHLANLIDRLPVALAEVATTSNLHDALLNRVTFDRPAARLNLSLRCGDLQTGYFDAILHYSEVRLDQTNLTTLQTLASHPKCELLYDEIDIGDDGCLCHRFLVWPEGEFEVHFASFTMDRMKTNNRHDPPLANVYVEAPIKP